MESKTPTAPPVPKAGHGQPQPPADHSEDGIPTDLHRPHGLVVGGVALLFAGLLIALYFIGLGSHQQERRQAQADADAKFALVPSVNVAVPKRDVAGHTVVLPCDIRPNQDTLIYSRTSGYLKKFYKDIGDRVAANELLAEIDTPEVDAQLEQAKAALLQAEANVAKAQADLDLAQRTLDRYQIVTGNGVAPQERDEKVSARDQAVAALAQTKASVKAAAADVDRLAVLQSFKKITAPFDGVITERNYDVGALLSAGAPAPGRELFRLTQSATLRVFINMPQVEASLVTLNSPAHLTVRNYPGREFTGTIARLAGALDPNTRTMPFELHFPNPNNELYAGMYGQVRLEISQPNPVLLVPTSALIFNAAGVQVAIVRDGKVHFQPVSLGNDRGTELEVTAGLSPDDHVIANPGERLSEGSSVRAVDPSKPTFTSATPLLPTSSPAAAR
jgi:RND family efflux transporter MFP subunit